MRKRWLAGASTAAVVASLVVAPVAFADTCCANTSVTFAPRAAEPRDEVRVERIACLGADNSGPLALNLVSFWLSTDDIPAEPSPGDVPGSDLVHLADDLPAVEAWIPFEAVSGTRRRRRGRRRSWCQTSGPAPISSGGCATTAAGLAAASTIRVGHACRSAARPTRRRWSRSAPGSAPNGWPPAPLLLLVGTIALVAALRHTGRGSRRPAPRA